MVSFFEKLEALKSLKKRITKGFKGHTQALHKNYTVLGVMYHF